MSPHPTRRAVLRILAAAPVLVALPRGARARAAAGGVYRGRVVGAAGRHTVPLVTGGHVVLGGRVRATAPHLYSIANANDRYAAWLDLGRRRRQLVELFLVLPDGTAVLGSSGWSRDLPSYAVFDGLAADQARRLAADWGIAVQDRAPLDRDLVARWRPRAPLFDNGAPIDLDLELENTGATDVHVRTSTVAADDFAFTATEAGVAVPAIPRTGITVGPMGWVRIAPGATATLSADLRATVAITSAGVYQVACRYRGWLEVDPTAQGVEHAHERWDLELTGAVEIRVE